MSSSATFGYCTFPDAATAARLCEQLVREGLVTCANVLAPHQSIYVWEGELRRETEVAALLKTDVSRREALKERIRAVHPYEVPALSFLEVTDGLPEFLRWLGPGGM